MLAFEFNKTIYNCIYTDFEATDAVLLLRLQKTPMRIMTHFSFKILYAVSMEVEYGIFETVH